MSGSLKVELEDGHNKQNFSLVSDSTGLIIPPMVWARQYDFSHDCTYLVLASMKYDESRLYPNHSDFTRTASDLDERSVSEFQNSYSELASDIDQAIKSVLMSGSYILGNKVEEFEEAWANYCTAKHAVGVSNGLDALTLALKAVGIEPGDEVIVPSHTYIATWLAISHCGAIPVPVEPQKRMETSMLR